MKIFVNICSCCMQDNVALKEQFYETPYPDVNNRKFISIFQQVFPEIKFESDCSYKLCEACAMSLLNTYLLKTTVLKNQVLYSNYLQDLKKSADKNSHKGESFCGLSVAVPNENKEVSCDNFDYEDNYYFTPILEYKDCTSGNKGTNEVRHKTVPGKSTTMESNGNAAFGNGGGCSKAIVPVGPDFPPPKPPISIPTSYQENPTPEMASPAPATPGAHQHPDASNVEKPYKCDCCAKWFARSSYLQKHLKKHTGETLYQCKVCYKYFIQLSHLNEHMNTHGGAKPFRCELCGKCFARSSHLNEHRMLHTGDKPYKCELCHKSFTRSSHLNDHRQIHTGEKPHGCEVCGKRFARSSHLKEHRSLHTGHKPHKCEYCGKCFLRHSQMRAHERKHVQQKMYECKTCGKGFKQLVSFNKHEMNHSAAVIGKNPYRCDVSDFYFAHWEGLRFHQKNYLPFSRADPQQTQDKGLQGYSAECSTGLKKELYPETNCFNSILDTNLKLNNFVKAEQMCSEAK